MPAPPHTHPREAVAARNRAAVLDGAERLLSRGDAPSISAVAAEAGVSRPTVYAHFPDRRRLIEAVVERAVGIATEAIAAAEPEWGAALPALRRVIAASWEQLSRHEQIGQAAMSELSTAAIHRSHHAAIKALRRLAKRGRREGAFRTDLPTELLVTGALGLIHAIADGVRGGVLDPGDAGGAADTLVT
ncbi:MAG: TetR/AcrR family transcriptional regulator, partial [Solirubrobacteraceae bacterium]